MKRVTLPSFVRLSKQMAILLLFAFLLAGCGGDEEATATPVDATPAAGGMVLPTAAPSQAQAVPATPTPALLIGDAVQVSSDQPFHLYIDATADALVMNVYAPGARFTLLDASGDYAVYPVEQAGQRWYRLRAADGLVGWGDAAQLAPAN